VNKEFPTFYFDPNTITPELKVGLYDMRYDNGEIARERKRAARKQQDKWPSFIGAKERRAPRPPKEWEIEPFFYRKNRVIIYGAPGSGKSAILMHMGVSLAAGIPWLDRYDIGEPRNVLYIDKENGEDLAIERCNRIEATLGVDTGDRLKIWADPGFMMNDRDPDELLDRFERIGWKADVILIDGLRRVLDGEENSSDDINVFWNNTAALRMENITIVLLHHTNKGDGIRGSIDIEAGTDKIFKLTSNDGSCTIMPEKERTGKTAPASLDVKIEGGTKETDSLNVVFVGQNGRESEEEPGSLKQATNVILAYLGKQPTVEHKTAVVLDHVESQGIGRRTGEAALQNLRTAEMVDYRRGFYKHCGTYGGIS
jgi:predicted ATP-dependent serine protease